jgi:hypothetical protein
VDAKESVSSAGYTLNKSWPAILFLPLSAFAADFEFTGGLERITQNSILIRLADGKRIDAKLPKAGPLASTTISAQYKLADEVQINCKPMGDHCADLKSIKFLRPPTPKERALVLGTAMPAGPPQPELEHARQVNLNRAANMPNFVADETAKRYKSLTKANPPEWKAVDTIQSEITFKGGDPTRDHIRINGKPWNKPRFPYLNWTPEFGTEIKPVFNPECPTEIKFEGPQELRGKQLLAYDFSSPSYGCFGGVSSQNKGYVPARIGRILVEAGGSMIQYEEEAIEFPKGFPVDSFKETTSWDYGKIGDSSYLLPVGYEFFFGFTGELWHVSVEYKNHRRFEAATNVTFH